MSKFVDFGSPNPPRPVDLPQFFLSLLLLRMSPGPEFRGTGVLGRSTKSFSEQLNPLICNGIKGIASRKIGDQRVEFSVQRNTLPKFRYSDVAQFQSVRNIWAARSFGRLLLLQIPIPCYVLQPQRDEFGKSDVIVANDAR